MSTRIAQFWLGNFGIYVVTAVVAIYAFDLYEPSWGRGGSLQVSIWLSLLVATISAVGFAIGVRVFRKAPKRLWSVASGAIIALVTMATTEIAQSTLEPNVLNDAVIVFGALLLSLIVAYFARGEAPRD